MLVLVPAASILTLYRANQFFKLKKQKESIKEEAEKKQDEPQQQALPE